MSLKKFLVLLVHAFIGWALCGAIIAVGRSITSMENTLIIHAIGVPIIFFAVSYTYFKKFYYTGPFWTALSFLLFAVIMDFFVVSLLIEKSFAMFQSKLGTWIPFILIFTVTYLTGREFRKSRS
jgi:hypothetical protein